MKNPIYIIFGLALMIMGCENPIRMETIVHEDGSLDKTIVLEEADSANVNKNIFGISAASGWKVTTQKSPHLSDSATSNKIQISFVKSFISSTEMNKELNPESDTLFRSKSSFVKKFRWFYTYIRYSETFMPIDRFKRINADDYFTQEDKMFIDRLPGEGMAVSKADSFYLDQLNEKIFNYYANWGLYEEEMQILREVLQRNKVDKLWLDSLKSDKVISMIYRSVGDDKLRGDKEFARKMADSLKIALPPSALKDFRDLSKDINSRVDFMSFAQNGTFTNCIEMPWELVETNADSVTGNKLFWRPLPTKFAIQQYEMYAEARKLNWWAVGVSLAVAGLAAFSFVKRKSSI